MITMCEYCGDVSKDTEFDIAREPYTVLVLKKYKDGRFSIMAFGDYEAEYFPAYCPMCGRRVNSEQK